jgi:PIN domain nuclease of toxin-antitoxin system
MPEREGAGTTLLLDTHVWIWIMDGSHHLLSASARDGIGTASRDGALLISAMSVWEVAMLEARGRVTLRRPVGEWIQELLRGPGARLLPLDPEIAVDSTRLPGTPHGDPSDRILMASARVTGAPLVTCDARILDYARGGHVPVLDARP